MDEARARKELRITFFWRINIAVIKRGYPPSIPESRLVWKKGERKGERERSLQALRESFRRIRRRRKKRDIVDGDKEGGCSDKNHFLWRIYMWVFSRNEKDERIKKRVAVSRNKWDTEYIWEKFAKKGARILTNSRKVTYFAQFQILQVDKCNEKRKKKLLQPTISTSSNERVYNSLLPQHS